MKIVESPEIEPTEAEQLFDDVVKTQRTKGRSTYGQGLDWRHGHGEDAPYDWRQMALEEAVDLSQYLCAEIVRGRHEIRNLKQQLRSLEEENRMEALTFRQYQAAAMRTAAPAETVMGEPMAVLALGLSGETGEVVELVKKYLGHGHPLDRQKIAKELGDVLWYVATLADACALDLPDIAEKNIAKLKERYPDGFSSEASRNRSVADY